MIETASGGASRLWWYWRAGARVLRRATMNFADDRCTHMAAAISYFALFSLFPLTVLAVSVFGLVLRDVDVQARVLEALVEALPIEETSVEDSLRSVANLGLTLTLVSLVATAWAAGALSSTLRRSLNVAFDVDRPRPLLRGKLLDYSLLPALGLLVLASFTLSAAWRVAEARAGDRLAALGGPASWLWDTGALAIPAALTFAAFLLLFWMLPNQRVEVRHIWPGALLAAVGVEAVNAGFAFYLSHFASYDVVYGSLGGVVALLFWVYLNANILLFGAEVAAEVPHVLREEPRHGHAGAAEGGWRGPLVAMLRGLVLAPGEQGGPAVAAHEDPLTDAGTANGEGEARAP